MRNIQVSKRGSEAAIEEQSDTWRKTERFEQEAPNASASSDPYVALEYPASGVGRGPYLHRSQLMWMTTCKFLRWMLPTRRMYEEVVTSEKCWIGFEEKMPEISREVNLDELVQNMTCLNALEWKIWKSNQKIVLDEESWKTWKK